MKLQYLPIVTLVMSLHAQAEMQWQDVSLSLLHGDNYLLAPDNRATVATLEHASGHNWGDTFLFVDHFDYNKGDSAIYGEFSPRLSLSYLTGKELIAGPIKDILLATTWEHGNGPDDVRFDNGLYGLGFALNITGFKYFNLNVYRRDNQYTKNNYQASISYALPFTLAGQTFLFDGFADWTSTTSQQRSSLNYTSQLKWQLYKGKSGNRLYMGMEYVYWNNKYGVKDSSRLNSNERNANLLLKYHF